MRKKFNVPDELWAIARRQDGVIGHAQAAALGLTRNVIQRLLDDHVLWQVVRGVYSPTPEPTWRGRAWAGLLLGGPGAALGYEAAGHLYGWCAAPPTIDVLVPRQAKDRGCWSFHQTTVASRGNPPVTTPERTAMDLCSRAHPRRLLGMLADVLTSRRTTAERLRAEARAMPNLPGRGIILPVLDDVAAGVHSHLEERFRALVERAHGLTGIERQVRVVPGRYSDVVYDAYRVIAELDGHLGHTGSDAFRDHRRDNRNAMAGWTTLRYGWDDVIGDACAVARQLHAALRARGWGDEFRRCPRCPG